MSFLAPVEPAALLVCGLFALVPPSMYIGVMRPQVVDVRGLVVRVVVYAAALFTYLALLMTGEAVLDVLGGARPSTGAVAVLATLTAPAFYPLLILLRGVVDQILFGERPDPLGAATQVAGRIGDDPALALRAIREALVLPYAAIRVNGQVVAHSGTQVTHTRTLDLAVGSPAGPGGPGRLVVGRLVVGLRAGDLALTANDQHVLGLAAPLLAQTIRATTLAADLQQSRGQTVTALEEERRRLRRDLHDGLGPRLSGIAFTSDAVRNSLRTDPDGAEELLRRLRADTVTAIEDIRELVYAMRPPSLDELGLENALRQQAAAIRTSAGVPLRLDLDADGLPGMSAAVEVATYRIVIEALTNIGRHSGSTSATVRLRVGSGGLEIDVEDSGKRAQAWTPGVGLASMRERAAEVGGILTAGPSGSGGRVRAVLPL